MCLTIPTTILNSEINTDTVPNVANQFIELRIVRTHGRRGKPPANPLENYILLIVRASDPAILLYAELGTMRMSLRDQLHFLVIGQEAVRNRNVGFDNAAIQSTFPNADEPNQLPHGDNSPYAILLINAASNRRTTNSFKLNRNAAGERFEERSLTPEEINMLKQFVVDMVVYGRRTPVTSCDVFDTLWPDKYKTDPEFSYILRDWDASRTTDFSINRCSSLDEPFQAKSFKYCPPSPGQINNCGQGYAFYLQNLIDLIAPMASEDDTAVAGCSAHQTVPVGRFRMIDQAKLDKQQKKMRERVTHRGVLSVPQASLVQDIQRINALNAEISELGGTPDDPYTVALSEFDQNWIRIASEYLPNRAALLTHVEYQRWVRIDHPGSNGMPLSFKCGVCIAYFRDQNVDNNLKRPITTPNGYYNARPDFNAARLIEHNTDALHLDALKYEMDVKMAKSVAERNALRDDARKKYESSLEPVVRMVRTVFVESQIGISFANHERIVELQKLNGVDMMYRYGGAYGAGKIVDVISTTMHEILLKYLISQNQPFSIIVDATTNTRNIPFFIIYINTLEDGMPISYFYRVLELKEGEGSIATFNVFWNAVLEDERHVPGFQKYVLDMLTFLVSDNAKVMIGDRQSFLTELRSKLNRNLPNIGCYAHKLSLVLKTALKDTKDNDFKIIPTFEKDLNGLYVFYQSRGSKRFQHLQATAEEFEIRPLRFKQNHPVRWAAAEERVISTVLRNRKIAELDLKEISEDKDKFPQASVREQALHLYETLVDMTNILLYHEFEDFLTINKILSETLQQRAGVLLDHTTAIISAFKQFESLKSKHGTKVTGFLATCNCPKTCSEPHCTMMEVEDCPAPVTCGESTYGRHIYTTDKLYKIREKLYEKMVSATEKYFQMEFITSVDVFNNRRYVWDEDVFTKDYIVESFNIVCAFLKYETNQCDSLSDNFLMVYNEITGDLHNLNEVDNTPSEFWSSKLQDPKSTISEELKMFIRKLLVMPDSSAEAERGFSVLSVLQRAARSSLEPTRTDALLRIKINAAKPISEIKAHFYAERFVSTMGRENVGRPQKKSATIGAGTKVSRLF